MGTIGAYMKIINHLDYRNMISGMIAGITTTMILHPLELIKVRMQVDETPLGSSKKDSKKDFSFRQQINKHHHYKGVSSALKEIYSQSGLRGLYAGVIPNIWGSGMSWGFYFLFYNCLKSMYIDNYLEDDQKEHHVKIPAYVHMLSAFIAGAITSVLTNPIWMMKTRLCLQDKSMTIKDGSGKTKYYSGMMDGLYKVVRDEGVLALYKGLSFGILSTLHGVVQFGVYEQLKQYNRLTHVDQYKEQFTPHLYAVYSGFSKICAVLTTYPFQLIRSRLQDRQSRHTKGIEVVRSILVNEGILSFYKGVTPTLLRVVPASCITFVVYETLKLLF